MSDHLQECIYESIDESRAGWRYCICDRLRAYEQRVRYDINKTVAAKMDLYDRQEVYFNQHGTGENP